VTFTPFLSVDAPRMIITRSTSVQMPSPPRSEDLQDPGADLTDVEAVGAEDSEEEAQQEGREDTLVC